MFCPADYRNFEEIFGMALEAALAYQPMPPYPYEAPMLSEHQTDFANDKVTQHLLAGAWLTYQTIQSEKIQWYACSPSGTILKVASTVTRSSQFGDELDILLGHKPPSFENTDCVVEAYMLAAKPLLQFVDMDTGTISIPENSGEETSIFHVNDAKFAAILRPLEGWALCTDADGFPQNPQELLDYLVADETATRRKHKGGRPPLKQEAIWAYRRAFPKGHGRKTWGEVETVTGYNAKTIQRAIKEGIDKT